MRPKHLFWQLFPSYLLVSVSVVVLVLLYASSAFRNFHLEQKASDLKVVASLLATQIKENSLTQTLKDHKSFEGSAHAHHSLRITLINSEGLVISDTSKDPSRMDNHASRPEVLQALKSAYGESIRYSDTLGQEMMYVALPLKNKAGESQIIRVSLPITSINSALSQMYSKLVFAGFFIVLLAIAFSAFISRRLSRPVEELKNTAARFAEGDLKHRATVSSPEELQSLGKAMNEMADQLKGKIETISNQKNELDVVLSSMKEGVIALDTNIRIMSVNRAALELLGISDKKIRGRLVSEVARNSELQELIRKVFEKEEGFQSEVTLRDNRNKILEINGSVLRDSTGLVMGALFVLHDVTEYKRLENIRTEFVANVSHELRTPITSIKGFVETLTEGAKDNPEELDRFLAIITRQTDRLDAIIEDLLALAKIERNSDGSEIEMVQTNMSEIFSSAIELSEGKASSKGLSLKTECSKSVEARVNPQLMSQALLNLIDNAIKYSNAGSDILISGEQRDADLVLSVQDHGCGIGEEHLGRLFERFYRVDKARSRELGGTGLGLAIVKHIAQAHRGSVAVESTLGEGTTFSIHIPMAA